MPKPKKKNSVSDEKIVQRFMEKKVFAPVNFNPCFLTKELFAIITIYGSAVMIILILFSSLNFFTSLLIKERGRYRNPGISSVNKVYKQAGEITYAVDKAKYGLNEEIGLSITNSSDKSIFLAPCQYFNKFEKKELNSWKTVELGDCKNVEALNSNEFEKIPLKEKQKISAVILGEGVWRGVSDIYLDCQKAEIEACKSKKVVYSNEFRIETKSSVMPDVL